MGCRLSSTIEREVGCTATAPCVTRDALTLLPMPDTPPPADGDAPTLHLKLEDGRPVLLRPVRPSDAVLIQKGLERLSSASRASRFFTPVSHLSDQQLQYLSDVDQVDHVAWGALDLTSDEVLGLGIGRFTRLASDPEVAEVALAVLDEAQGHGLGSLLFGVLYCLARSHDVSTFRAVVMPYNQGLVERLRAIGGEVHHEEGQVLINVPVVTDTDVLPSTPEADRLKDVLRTIEAALAET